MTALLIGAWLAGLLGSPHCVGMCGPFALACAGTRGQTLAWNAGRLATYAVLGAAAGVLGQAAPGPPWVVAVISTALIVWFAGALAGILPEPHLVIPGLARLSAALARRAGLPGRFMFGMATSLLPCGLVYAALGIPVAIGTAGGGALAMVAFGLGTVPALAAVAAGLHRFLAGGRNRRRLLAAGVLVAGLWSIGMRAGLWNPGTPHGPPAGQAPQTGSPNGPGGHPEGSPPTR